MRKRCAYARNVFMFCFLRIMTYVYMLCECTQFTHALFSSDYHICVYALCMHAIYSCFIWLGLGYDIYLYVVRMQPIYACLGSMWHHSQWYQSYLQSPFCFSKAYFGIWLDWPPANYFCTNPIIYEYLVPKHFLFGLYTSEHTIYNCHRHNYKSKHHCQWRICHW